MVAMVATVATVVDPLVGLPARRGRDYHGADMIDYATLCKAIDDWKAGHQPSGVIPAAPKRVPTRPSDEEEGVVEYSAAYDIGEARPEEVPDSTVIYQMSEYDEAEAETEADAEAETDVEAETEVEAEADADDEVR
jgi:hypothetical protein